jgi:TonB family protein
MATASMRREQQLDLYPRPVEPFVPHFEQVESRWTWKHFAALAGFSLLAHIAFLLCVVALIIALPKNSPIVLTARELIGKDESVKYMPLAADQQKPLEPPKTNVISDKDRIKSSRTPTIDRKTLDSLADNLRRGAPTPPPSPQVNAAVAQQQAQPQPQAQTALQSGASAQPTGPQIAQLHTPNVFNSGRRAPSFGDTGRAGSAIQQAAQAASQQRSSGGVSGEYGSGPAIANSTHRDALEILSDTLGVDFAPYLRRMHLQVSTNWENVMPESVFPPLRKQGVVVIEFSILQDGTVTGIKLVGSSGDVALDRAAYAAISASNPMPHLPADFRSDYFTVRAHFYYNPAKNEMQQMQ